MLSRRIYHFRAVFHNIIFSSKNDLFNAQKYFFLYIINNINHCTSDFTLSTLLFTALKECKRGENNRVKHTISHFSFLVSTRWCLRIWITLNLLRGLKVSLSLIRAKFPLSPTVDSHYKCTESLYITRANRLFHKCNAHRRALYCLIPDFCIISLEDKL